MPKLKLTEGEARLLVAVFDHLKICELQAASHHTSVADEMNDPEEHGYETYGELLKMAMRITLSPRDREIIIRRYGLSEDRKCYTYEEIARKLNASCEFICQREGIALKKIKHYMTELNDNETTVVVIELGDMARENLLDANDARDKGRLVEADMYMKEHDFFINAINKLKILQEVRMYRIRTE